jgi:hypothetical protein
MVILLEYACELRSARLEREKDRSYTLCVVVPDCLTDQIVVSTFPRVDHQPLLTPWLLTVSLASQ